MFMLVAGYGFSGKCSKRADLSFGEFANGNLDKFARNGYWVPQLLSLPVVPGTCSVFFVTYEVL
jgi:hypothetical protein